MKKIALGVAIVTLIALFFTTVSSAQMGPGFNKWRGSGGWGMGTPYQRMYDPTKVETIKGTVEAVETVKPMKGMNNGIALIVKTGKETIQVNIGPQWYIERLDTKIQKGDAVEVRGSRVNFAGNPAIIAAEVKKGGETLVLRNEAGVPAWAGWRRQ